MCWFGFASDVAAAADWYEVVEGERIAVQWWQAHVYGVAAEPAGCFFGVLFEAAAFPGDAVLPSPGLHAGVVVL